VHLSGSCASLRTNQIVMTSCDGPCSVSDRASAMTVDGQSSWVGEPCRLADDVCGQRTVFRIKTKQQMTCALLLFAGRMGLYRCGFTFAHCGRLHDW
jgi:hypothetical protein